MKLTSKPKASSFVNIQVWRDTKIALVEQLKKRNRGQKVKQSLASYIDDISKVNHQ